MAGGRAKEAVFRALRGPEKLRVVPLVRAPYGALPPRAPRRLPSAPPRHRHPDGLTSAHDRYAAVTARVLGISSGRRLPKNDLLMPVSGAR